MSNRCKAWLLSVALPLLGSTLGPQPARADDTQLWNEFIVDFSLTEKLSLQAASEQDWVDDVSRFGLWNVTLEPCFAAAAWLDLGAGYRHEQTEKQSDWQAENRYWVHTTLRHKVAGWSFSLRPKLEFRDFEEDDAWRFRTRLKVQRPARVGRVALTPYLSDEVLYDVETDRVNQNRAAAGVRWRVTNRFQVGGYYLHLARLSDGAWGSCHVVGTEWLVAF